MTSRGWLTGLLVITLGAVVCWQLVRERGGDATSGRDEAPRVLQSAQRSTPDGATGPLAIAPRPEPSPLGEARDEPAPELPVIAAARAPVGSSLATVGEAVHVTARIVDASGTPLAGARAVWLPSKPTLRAAGLLAPLADKDAEREADVEPGADDHVVPPFAELPQAIAGADGRVALDARHVPIDESARTSGGLMFWTPSQAVLLVTLDGWAARTTHLKDVKGGERDAGDIVLEPEARVTGRAVDESGRPLAGVRIRVAEQNTHHREQDGNRLQQWELVPELMQRVTADDGRFALAGLWEGDTRLELLAPERIRRECQCAPRRGETLDLGDLTVQRGAAIAGRVLDAAGAPVAGAKVLVADGEIRWGSVGDVGYGYDEGDDSIHDELSQIDVRRHPPVLADATGAFRVGALDSPQVSVYATAVGFEPARLRPVAPGAMDLKLVVQREAVLRITVVDRGTRAPLPQASVAVRRLSGVEDVAKADVELRVEADAAGAVGAFLARGAGPHSHRVTASAPGHATAVVEGPGVAAPQRADFVVELGPEAVLAGRVLDAQGTPLPGATVELRKPDLAYRPLLQVSADEQGAFRIERLAATTAELVAFAKGLPDSAALPVTLGEGEHREGLTLQVPAATRLHGTVLKTDGTPAVGGNVRIDVPPFDGGFKYEQLSARFVSWVPVDDQGRYAFEALRPGDYQVESFGCATVTCTLAEGEDRTIDFRASAGVHVHGHVTSAGKPVVGAHITASKDREADGPPLGWVTAVVTDEQGAYALDLRGAGDIELHTDGLAGHESEHVTVHVNPGEDVVADLVLPAGRITGRVVDDVTGAVVRGLAVELYRDEKVDVSFATTAEDGAFSMDWLPANTYRLRIDGYGSIEGGSYGKAVLPLPPRDIALAEGQGVDDVVLTVCHGGTLTGAVRLPDGSSVADRVMVQLVHVDHGRIVPTVSTMSASGGEYGDDSVREEGEDPIWARAFTEGGRYRAGPLAAGEYRVLVGEASAEEVRDHGAPVIVGEHEVASLDLVAR